LHVPVFQSTGLLITVLHVWVLEGEPWCARAVYIRCLGVIWVGRSQG
jgi:hypothetical protein